MTGTRPATWSSTVVMTLLALVVGQHELLGEVREDADAVRSRIDHEVDGALLAFEIELAAVVEDGRRDGKHAAIGARGLLPDEDMVSPFSIVERRGQ